MFFFIHFMGVLDGFWVYQLSLYGDLLKLAT